MILDARYEKGREDGVIGLMAVQIAIGINRESQSSRKDFLLRLNDCRLTGVEFVVSDDHAGLRKAISEVLCEVAWQRYYVHFLRNALDYLPRRADDDWLRELRWIYDRRDLQEANRDLAAWITK